MMRFCAFIFCLIAGFSFAGMGQPSEMAMKDLDDVPRHPMEPGDKDASVLIFFWQDCPISNSYAPELNRIAASHTNFAFYIVQVDPELTPADAREHARKFDLREPVLLDPKHVLVKLVKATVTPEAVVVGKDGHVLYRGRIDDRYPSISNMRSAATEHDLVDVLEAVTAHKPLKRTETKPIGCVIQ